MQCCFEKSLFELGSVFSGSKRVIAEGSSVYISKYSKQYENLLFKINNNVDFVSQSRKSVFLHQHIFRKALNYSYTQK